MTNNPDKLLQKAREFDQDALGDIYDQYSGELFAYVYKHVGDTQLAEDLVGDTFKRFLRALSQGGGPTDHLRAYLYRITHNLITDCYRREPQPPLEIDPDELAKESQQPADLLSKQQEANRLRQALQLITAEQRQVITLRFLEGWSTAEIARVMDKSIGAVKALQHRGLAALERILLKAEKSDN